jgi:hypothetical protein
MTPQAWNVFEAYLERQLPMAFEQKELQRSASSSSSMTTWPLILSKLKMSHHLSSSVFFLLLPADLINRLGSLAVRTRYEKVFFHTKTKTGYPLEGIPQHICKLLTKQQWGYWHVPKGQEAEEQNHVDEIQVDALFDFGGHSHQVVDVEDNQGQLQHTGSHQCPRPQYCKSS